MIELIEKMESELLELDDIEEVVNMSDVFADLTDIFRYFRKRHELKFHKIYKDYDVDFDAYFEEIEAYCAGLYRKADDIVTDLEEEKDEEDVHGSEIDQVKEEYRSAV